MPTSSNSSVLVNPLLPWQKADVSVELRSPGEAGIYESKWRMSTANGVFFGDTIWVIITVEPAGTLALTQQMNNFSVLPTSDGGGGGQQQAVSPPATATLMQHANPFAVNNSHQRQQGDDATDQDMN